MILSIFSKRNETANTNSCRPESNWFPPVVAKAHCQDQDCLKINPLPYGLAGPLA